MSLMLSLIFVFYLAVTLFLGFKGYQKTKTAADFLLAGRQANPMVMALSYGATFISTSAIVGFGGLASQLGGSLLLLPLFNIFIGIFVAFVFLGKKTRRMGHHLNAHTFPELIGKRYQSAKLQKIAGVVIFIFMPIYASAVLIGGARFIEIAFSLNYDVALLLFAVIIAAYVMAGGIKGVLYSDAFQAAIMIIGIVILLISTYMGLGGVVSSHKKFSPVFKEVHSRVETDEKMKDFNTNYLKEKYGVELTSDEYSLISDNALSLNAIKDKKEQIASFLALIQEKAPHLKLNNHQEGVLNRFIYTHLEQKNVRDLQSQGLRGWDEMPQSFSNQWWIIFSTFVLGVGIGVLAQPQLAVRFMMVKSDRDLNRGVGVGGLFILLMTGGAYLVGMLSNIYFFENPSFNTVAVAATGGNIDQVIPHFINTAMPKWFTYIFMLTLLSAAMSTLSSQLHTMGTSVSKDILRLGKDDNEMDKQTMLWSKLGILAGIIITILLGYILGEGIVARGTALFFGIASASFLPLFVGGLYSKKVTRMGALVSILAGFLSSLIWMVFFQLAPARALGICKSLFGVDSLVLGTSLAFVDPLVIGLPLSILGLILGSKFSKKIDEEHVKYCFQEK